jgi:hypothetical protein
VTVLYDFHLTESFSNQQQQIDYVAKEVKKLLDEGDFVHGGLDHNVR